MAEPFVLNAQRNRRVEMPNVKFISYTPEDSRSMGFEGKVYYGTNSNEALQWKPTLEVF